MIKATVVKASELFEFAEQEELADYWAMDDLIDVERQRQHSLWHRSCFTLIRGGEHDWLPQVKEMVRRYMNLHNIEVLVIVNGTDAHLTL